MHNLLPRLIKDGPEHQAIEAGEIDAIIDHPSSNVILLPAARRALREAASRASGAKWYGANEARRANALLAALPHKDYLSLDALEPVTLKFGEVLQEPEAPLGYVYFPVDCVISLLAPVEPRQAVGVGLVGHEGMVGISLVLGADLSSVSAVVQATGKAVRMNAALFQKAFRQSLPLQRELYRYCHVELARARQTVACNRFHALEARLVRWLLMTSDRARSGQFFLTQALLADLVGVRRASINQVAVPLHRRGLISYSRGWIRILDRQGLEAACCGCYTRIEAGSAVT